MNGKIHTFHLPADMRLMGAMNRIENFSGSWDFISKRENKNLRELKSVAMLQSTGASTRIEGSEMTDDEVAVFVRDLSMKKLSDRDQQEVAGYYLVCDIISESYKDIDISESSIKNLHNLLMKYSEKDEWHKGAYKKHPNSVEATDKRGRKTILFESTPPGFQTDAAMQKLVKWYHRADEIPALIKTAAFVYDFLSIHPFQDGNGRMSRLLTTLLLLKNNYAWIEYISLENEIENRKAEYYRTLMDCQRKRPGENIYLWVLFFLDCLQNIQEKLKIKLENRNYRSGLSPKEKMVFSFIENHPGCQSGEVARKLNIPLPTVKKILLRLAKENFLQKYGNGKGTSYTVEEPAEISYNRAVHFNKDKTTHEFILNDIRSFIELKKIILTPLFSWKKPDDWSKILLSENPVLKITCSDNKNNTTSRKYLIASMISPMHYEPVFTFLHSPLLPSDLTGKTPPCRILLELVTSKKDSLFETMVVFDGSY